VSVAPELGFAWTAIDEERARALAEQLHRGRLDRGGAPLIDHIRRVAAAVSGDARVVAWPHEVLEYAAVSEQSLLAEGVSNPELRALRLLTRDTESRSIARYLGHVRLIADAVGPGAGIARQVKHADSRRPRRASGGQRRRPGAAVRPRPRDPQAHGASY
jgi:hypothetical protein